MSKLMTATAVLALLCGAPAFAQEANSGSTSGSVSGSASSANNGGVNVAPVTATSGSSSNANAQTSSTSVSASQGGNSASQSGAATAGNNQGVTLNTTSPKSVKTVPAVYAPALTTTLTETCMGSTTAGGAGLGVGVTIGTTWRDDECVRRLNAREIGQLIGDREAARAILCGSKSVREAYDAIGRPCPQSPNYRAELATSYLPMAQPAGPPVITLPPAAAPMSVTPTPANPAPHSTMQPIPNPESGERG